MRTFWLEPSEHNRHVNNAGMMQLEMETDELLMQTKFESDLEKKTLEQSTQLAASLGQGMMSEKQQQVMGPVLDIIRKELIGKNQLSISIHGTPNHSSHQPKGDLRDSLHKTKSWDAPDPEQAKKLEKHFGKSDRGYKYTPGSPRKRHSAPARAMSDDAKALESLALKAHEDHNKASLVGMVKHGMVVEAAATKSKSKKRGGKRSSKKSPIVPALPPAQLFDILERALDEFDDDSSFSGSFS